MAERLDRNKGAECLNDARPATDCQSSFILWNIKPVDDFAFSNRRKHLIKLSIHQFIPLNASQDANEFVRLNYHHFAQINDPMEIPIKAAIGVITG